MQDVQTPPKRGLNRAIPAELHPPHIPAIALVIVDGNMLKAAIIPKRDGARRPRKAAGEFRLCRVFEEILQKRLALFLRHPFEIMRRRDVNVERLSPGLRMRADDRMLYRRHRGQLFRRQGRAFLFGVILPGAADQELRLQAVDPVLCRLRKRFVCRVHVVEQRVAPRWRDLQCVQQRPQTRHVRVREIGVPAPSGGIETDEGAIRRLLVGDFQNFRVIRQQELIVDVAGKIAEPAAEGDMLRRRDFLIAEYEYLIGEMRLMNFREGHFVEWLGEVQSDNLRAQRIG